MVLPARYPDRRNRLGEDEIREIILRPPQSNYAEIGREFGISKTNVRAIKQRRLYLDVWITLEKAGLVAPGHERRQARRHVTDEMVREIILSNDPYGPDIRERLGVPTSMIASIRSGHSHRAKREALEREGKILAVPLAERSLLVPATARAIILSGLGVPAATERFDVSFGVAQRLLSRKSHNQVWAALDAKGIMVKENPRSGRAKAARRAAVKALLEEDPERSQAMVAEMTGASLSIVNTVRWELGHAPGTRGLTPGKKRRIQEAMQMLDENPCMTIAEAAKRAGICNDALFKARKKRREAEARTTPEAAAQDNELPLLSSA